MDFAVIQTQGPIHMKKMCLTFCFMQMFNLFAENHDMSILDNLDEQARPIDSKAVKYNVGFNL